MYILKIPSCKTGIILFLKISVKATEIVLCFFFIVIFLIDPKGVLKFTLGYNLLPITAQLKFN